MKVAELLSGGMDSLAVAYWKRPEFAITIDYGQLAATAEIAAAHMICTQLQIEHHVIRVDCRELGSGDMAGIEPQSVAPESDWWPFRNQLLITLAAMKVMQLKATHLLIGTVKSDHVHLDGTKAFVETIGKLLEMQEGQIRVEAPALDLDTVELVRAANVPLDFLAWSHSCHKSDVTCGNCRGCNKYFDVWNRLLNDVD